MNNFEKDFRLFARDHKVSGTMVDSYGRFVNSYINPTITEERKLNVAQMDVFSRLLMDRILFLGTDIDSDVANIINSQLLFLQTSNDSAPINMYINSRGGSVSDGMSIYDVMKIISCPVSTTCIGTAASMAAVLLSSGEKGNRFALPHSEIMVHAPSGGTGRVTAPDFMIAAREMEKCQNMLYQVLSEETGQPFDHIKEICDRDHWMTPIEAKAEGVIDEILTKVKK